MVRATKRSEVVLEVVVLSLIFGVSLVFAGDIVHQDNIAPKRPGCDNNFVLVKVPTWIGNNGEEEFVGVGARFGPSLESKEKDATKSRVTLADHPDFISNQGSLVPNTALGRFSSSGYSEDELLPMVASKNLTLSYSSESSIEVELKRERTADPITILVLFGLSGVMLVMLSVIVLVVFFQCSWSKIKIYTRHHGSHSFFCFGCNNQRKPRLLTQYMKNDGMIAEARSFKLDQILSLYIAVSYWVETKTQPKTSPALADEHVQAYKLSRTYLASLAQLLSPPFVLFCRDFENFVNNRVWFKKRIIQQTTNAVSEQQPADDDEEECTNAED
ncbi:hypothetical protein LXL04_029529 [Taraxacum kok-saghyz]